MAFCLAMAACLHSASAQPAPAEQVTAQSRHIAEMQELLSSRDANIRDAAIETALSDASPAVRGLAISYALRRYDRLALAFALPPGSTVQQADLPSVSLGHVTWSPDGRSMVAAAPRCGGGNMSGQVTGDRLLLHFADLICLGGDIAGLPPPRPGGRVTEARFRDCEAELVPSRSRDALEGMLHCPGLRTTLPLRLPLG